MVAFQTARIMIDRGVGLCFDSARVSSTMLLKITRGLGGSRGILILTVMGLVGVVAILAAWLFRQNVVAPPPVSVIEASPGEMQRLGREARGALPEVPYVSSDLARIVSDAVAQRSDETWHGLAAGTVLKVFSTTMEGKSLWVSGIVQGGASGESLKIHSSFLERYTPVSLADTLELSDVRLVHVTEAPTPKLTVTGWLRNVSSQTLSQCTVMCTFEDKGGAKLDRQPAPELVVQPQEFIHFETAPTATEKQFAQITLEISHATPDGLRNYLPTVVIPRSAGQHTQ